MSLRPHLEKQLNLLDYALSCLWRRRVKNLSVLLVFAGVIFLLASFQLLTSSLTRTAALLLREAPEITVQRMSAGRQESLPLETVEKVQKIFGIRRIVPRIWGYYFDEAHLANYTVLGIDHRRMPKGDELAAALLEGRLPEPGETDTVVVGGAIAATMELADRRVFSLFRPDLSLKPLRIVGTFKEETALLTADTLFMGLDTARDLFRLPEAMVSDLCIYVANPAEIDTIAKKIALALPDCRVLTKPQIRKTYQVVFGWRSGFASVCLLTAIVAFAILAWDKASGLSPEERREIGILKILGWETADVLTIRFWEGLLLAGLAFGLGCMAAYVHVVFFEAALFRPVMLGWSVLRPPLGLVPAVGLGDLLLVFTFSVVPYLAATVVPAWRSAIVPPDSALRG